MININKLWESISNKGLSYSKRFLIPLATVITMAVWMWKVKANNTEALLWNLKWNEISFWEKQIDFSNTLNLSEFFDKEWVAEEYLKNNLFIKWKPITNEEFNHNIQKIEKDIYQIKYSHEFEWISNFSEASKRDITIKVKFTYKDNNIFIEFDKINVWWFELQDNWTLILDNTVYDYDISQWVNKSIEINSKANPYKTSEMIKNKIKENKFSFSSKIENIKEFENTQLTKLNDISLWQEVMREWEFYYREVFLTEKWQYRPIWKIYFDKYWKLDENKTNEEIKNKEILVLWVKLIFNKISVSGSNIQFSLNDNSKENLKEKVSDHRKTIINIIDKAKVGPNTEFKWFNKIRSKRVWSDKEEWLFNTWLITLELIDDTYVFQRWDKNQSICFWIESKDWSEDNVFLKNLNNQKIEDFFITINNNYYKVTLKNNELAIYKIQKEWVNITNNLPSFSWDKNIVSIMEDKNINHYYNTSGKQLEYRTNDWIMITSIPCEKSEKWEYKINKASTNINIEDLYNFPEFKKTTDEIKKIQKKLNTLDIDILNSFQILLVKEWIKLNNQNLIRVVDKKWTSYYCNIKEIKNWIQINPDVKLYKDVENTLRKIKSRLEIVERLNDTKIRWTNNGKKEDFTKFVWWWRWIGTRFISQNNIISFISQSTNEIKLDILRWEWQITSIIYDISRKSWKMKLKWKSKITISWQEYKIKINEKWEIFLDPIEKK